MFNEIAYAQTSSEPQTPQGPLGGGSSMLLYIILMFAIFYFFLIRPQQKKSKEQENFLKNLKEGDEVITSSGIYGKIIKIKDLVVTLEIAEKVRIKILKGYISALAKKDETIKEEEKKDK